MITAGERDIPLVMKVILGKNGKHLTLEEIIPFLSIG